MKADPNTGEIIEFNRQDMLSGHFKMSEFCHGAQLWPTKYAERLFRLVALLEDVRAHIGAPVKITSGYRSPHHNAATAGAAKHSAHVYGFAVDFRIVRPHHMDSERDTLEALKFLEANRSTWNICGLGWYPLFDTTGTPKVEASGIERSHSRVHVDLRHLPYRTWTK